MAHIGHLSNLLHLYSQVPADVHDSTKNMVQSSSDGDSVSSGVAAAFAAAFEYGNDSGNGTNGESGRDSKSQSGGPSGGGSNFPLLSSVLPDLLGGPDTSPGEGKWTSGYLLE